ncbi:hypothetical protein ACFWH7_17400 [Cellulosimicrobium cellulans]
MTSPARPRPTVPIRLLVKPLACPIVRVLVDVLPARPGVTAARGSMTS